MPQYYFMYFFSGALIITGVVFLFKEKKYFDTIKNEVISVEIPFFGKIKSNYPSVIIIFIAAAIAFYTFRQKVCTVEWIVQGYIEDATGDYDYRIGTLTVLGAETPADAKDEMQKDGKFTIEIGLPEGISLEQGIDHIRYEHQSAGYFFIDTKAAYKEFKEGDTLLLQYVTPLSRMYKTKLN